MTLIYLTDYGQQPFDPLLISSRLKCPSVSCLCLFAVIHLKHSEVTRVYNRPACALIEYFLSVDRTRPQGSDKIIQTIIYLN